MKLHFAISLFFLGFLCNSQKLRPATSIAYHRQTLFDASGLYDLGLGLEYKVKSFLRPQISTQYLFGRLFFDGLKNDKTIYYSNLTNANAVVVSAMPKFLVWKNDSELISFAILPKYNLAFMNVTNTKLEQNVNSNVILLNEKKNTVETRHSIGLGLGVNIDFSKKNYDSLELVVWYQNIDLGRVINQLNNSSTKVNTKDMLGIGIIYCISTK